MISTFVSHYTINKESLCLDCRQILKSRNLKYGWYNKKDALKALSEYKQRTKQPRKEFRKKLLAFLKENKAEIYFKVGDCSDIYGLYEECLNASFVHEGEVVHTKLVDGWNLS